ncbi:MAG TPA: 2-C-methyl-D-erythritol 2,4-cyclodiphosphate synthase [Actinomycetota bacterium]|nr:2-C-methyl-D-erythritol 2,4-cyclodiphosphate synthase [Actinomycetota bacterium]
MRAGIGFDVHGFADDRPLLLGGVVIPGARGLEGHSDADIVCHAVADAVLGAAALGDLGMHFPSGDARWKGARSTELLRSAVALAADSGLRVVSVDVTVVIEQPALAPYRDEMRKQIAACCGLDVSDVSIKATTTDGLGLVGRGEGAAALAVATLDAR